ncbi:hypothetical protein LSH36_1111g01015 [Paralvinella palmiformis]|uniref:Uncharacterized protein n=1 Tax=Paralvinella palmiformis TaxID=53620 RepID=A0AAD9MRF7_9ANNE|nr:hypothetical protein LSH36_1111g01015 [Paralvinella palmiformis]
MAAYSEDQLKRLSEKAEHYIARRGGTMKPLRELVRDKTAQYYYNITTTTGIMETYEKDVHGDPRSPVNVRLRSCRSRSLRISWLYVYEVFDPQQISHGILCCG